MIMKKTVFPLLLSVAGFFLASLFVGCGKDPVVVESIAPVIDLTTDNSNPKYYGESTVHWMVTGNFDEVYAKLNGVRLSALSDDSLKIESITETQTFSIYVVYNEGKEINKTLEITPQEQPIREALLCAGPFLEIKRIYYFEGKDPYEADLSFECLQDDIWRFFPNGKVKFSKGTIFCEGDDPNTVPLQFSWKIEEDTLRGLGDPRFIETLNDTILVWSVKSTLYDEVAGKIIPGLLKQTFKRL